MLAHAQLVTTDLAIACFLFIAIYCFYRALNRLTIGNGLLVGLTAGLCLVAKFSGVLVFPIYPFLIVFASKVARAFTPPLPRRLAIACGLLLGWYVAMISDMKAKAIYFDSALQPGVLMAYLNSPAYIYPHLD